MILLWIKTMVLLFSSPPPGPGEFGGQNQCLFIKNIHAGEISLETQISAVIQT